MLRELALPTPSKQTTPAVKMLRAMVSTRGSTREVVKAGPDPLPTHGHPPPIDPRLTAPLPMIHGADLTLSHLTHDPATFIPFYGGRHSRIKPENDPSLDPAQGFLHPSHPIYKFGGPVYRVQHPMLGLMDTMLCNTDVCAVCNHRVPLEFVPKVEESPSKGLPFVHSWRDCREVEEDGTLQYWQTSRVAMFVEEFPKEMRVAKVRFVMMGMAGPRDAVVCVPESCKECKGLIGMERVESEDGSLIVWKKKEAGKENVVGEQSGAAGQKDGGAGKKKVGLMGPPPRPHPK
ncbi:hypothetical protein PRZ48_008811 [Zasmidium cellare]|uniref:Uncharacterized protein n=1 Tax=Zasmidium cellare TaxID=395010 RepID=A0ABR0EGM8_ZASCE|nr:hypothetical protein PRZ48_008811 [Zasmidium cellare]